MPRLRPEKPVDQATLDRIWQKIEAATAERPPAPVARSKPERSPA